MTTGLLAGVKNPAPICNAPPTSLTIAGYQPATPVGNNMVACGIISGAL